MTTVARTAALRHQNFTRLATPKGQGPIPVTVDTFEAFGGGGVGSGVGVIPLGRGGDPRTGIICRAVHCTDCYGSRWRLQPNKDSKGCSFPVSVWPRPGLQPVLQGLVGCVLCARPAQICRTPCRQPQTRKRKYAEERRMTQAAAANARWPHKSKAAAFSWQTHLARQGRRG